MDTVKKNITTRQMEIALVSYFDKLKNLIVPNVSWGFMPHECDLLVMSKSGYLTEIEIKVSKADLMNDFKKNHQHESHMVANFFYAVPHYMIDHTLTVIPEHAGLIAVYEGRKGGFYAGQVKPAKRKKTEALTCDERYKLARLGAIRIWDLKKKIEKILTAENKKPK